MQTAAVQPVDHADRLPGEDDTLTLAGPAPLDAGAHRLGFRLFLLLNAVLFIRPSEILPALDNWPIYLIVMFACVAASLPAMLGQLSARALTEHPTTLFVLAVLPAIVLSRLTRFDLYEARHGASDFFKVLIYYLLLVALTTSVPRFRTFLLAATAFVTVTAGLAVLKYHGVIEIESMKVIVDGRYNEWGDYKSDLRLQATGIFSDPNDLSLVLVTGMLVCGYVVTRRGSGGGAVARAACLLMIPVLAYAFFLTRSRGGFLALVVGLATYVVAAHGWRRAVPYAVLGLPVIVVLFGGRSTNMDISSGDDTGQGRIQLWRDSLVLMSGRYLPFGIGWGKLPEENGLVAHNSYVHAFSELGLIGGSMFVSAILVPVAAVRWLRERAAERWSPEVANWWPCVLAIGVAYAVGLCTLSRVYEIPTYFVIGVLVAYGRVAAADAPGAVPPLSRGLLVRAAVACPACLLTFHFFVRVVAR